jgi:hypothetical protein
LKGDEGDVAQTIGEGEGVKEVRDKLAKPKVLTLSLEPFVLSFYMMDRLMFAERVGGRSRM